jgi:HD-GYP domain-containing protein (c-di-GMP phosphodiesterase class II)
MKATVSTIVDDIIQNKDVMVNVIDLKVYDDYTYYHSLNVAILAVAIGLGIGLNRETLNALGISAVLHDIGKRFVPKDILEKKGSLTAEEFDVIKEHSQIGYSYIRENLNLSSVSNVAILQHHERYDGSGYPFGKKEQNITPFARILSVVDVYDALTSKRPYHEPRLPHLALEYIEQESGKLFDPHVTKVFLKKIAPYPVGTDVELSNGYRGLVVEIIRRLRPDHPLRFNVEKMKFVILI